MTSGTEIKAATPNDNKVDNVVVLGLVALLFTATITAGANSAYLLMALGGVGAFFYYRSDLDQWLNDHQSIWIGAAAGFFFGGASFGPIGLALGAWLGHAVEQKVNTAMKVVDKVTAPITYAKETTTSLWNNINSGVSRAYQFVVGDEKTDAPATKTPKPTQPVATSKRPSVAEASKEIPVNEPAPIVHRKSTKTIPAKESQEPVVKRRRHKRAQKGWQVWETLSAFFTSPSPVEKAKDPVKTKRSKTVTWQQEIAKNKVPKPQTTQPKANTDWYKPILTIM